MSALVRHCRPQAVGSAILKLCLPEHNAAGYHFCGLGQLNSQIWPEGNEVWVVMSCRLQSSTAGSKSAREQRDRVRRQLAGNAAQRHALRSQQACLVTQFSLCSTIGSGSEASHARRYREDPADDRRMEASWQEMQSEERRSAKLGRAADKQAEIEEAARVAAKAARKARLQVQP